MDQASFTQTETITPIIIFLINDVFSGIALSKLDCNKYRVKCFKTKSFKILYTYLK